MTRSIVVCVVHKLNVDEFLGCTNAPIIVVAKFSFIQSKM